MIRPSQVSVPWMLPGILIWMLLSANSVSATTLTATIAAEGDFEAYVSVSGVDAGTLFLDSNQAETSPGVGTFELAEGVLQYLHIKVKAGSVNPSNLIGTFTLSDIGFTFPNLLETVSTDLTYWIVSRTGFGTNLEFLSDLGANGSAPWGSQTGIGSKARYIWSDTDSGDHYFTLALHPTNSTARRFVVGVQPLFNNIEGILTETEGVPYQLSYQDGPSRALAAAYPGRAGVRTEEVLTQGPGDLYTAAWASYDSPDYILTTTGDDTSADISLNFMVKGTMVGGAGKGGLPVEKSISSSQVDVYARVNNEPLYFGRGTITARYEVGTETPGTEVTVSELFVIDLLPDDVTGDAGDYLAEYNVSIDRLFTTDTYNVEVGVPFSVVLNNQIISTAASDTGQAGSKIDFTGGVSFPTSGDVFNLPPGFTVNSISGIVVNNRFEVPEEPKEVFPEGMFLKLPDIDGESIIAGRESWVDLEDISSWISRMRGGYRTISPLLGDLTVTKYIDKSSPKLAEALSNGSLLDEVLVEYNQVLSEVRRSSFQYRLKDVVVSDFGIAASAEDSVPLEQVSFNYDYVDWVYRLQDAGGATQGEVNAWWNVSTDQGGSESKSGDNNPPSTDPVGNQSVGSGASASVDIAINDMETQADNLVVTVSTTRPDLLGELVVTGTGANRQVSYKTSALRSGFASILLTVSDGTDSRSTAIPVLIGVEMTPFEGFLAAYFTEEDMFNPEIASPILDPDKDGIATVIEYLLGTNPTEFNGSSEALKVALDSGGEKCQLILDFNKRLDDPNIQGYIWTSQNLKDWVRMDSANPMYEETGQQGQNPLFEETTATITFPDVCKEPHFIRFQVQDVF